MFTLLQCMVQINIYITIETKEAARIGYSGSLFPHESSGEGRGA